MEHLFTNETTVSSSFLFWLINIMDLNSLASFSLCSKTIQNLIIPRFQQPSPADDMIKSLTGSLLYEFYVFMGRLAVPQIDRNPRWKCLPVIITNPRTVAWAIFIVHMVGGEYADDVANNVDFISNLKDSQNSYIFCSLISSTKYHISKLWNPSYSIALVCDTYHDFVCPGSFEFFFDTTEDNIMKMSKGDDVRIYLRSKCMFYTYRSEWIRSLKT